MKKIKSRLQLIVIALLICLVAATARETIAYFTDSKASTDVFTVGNVYITLTQTAFKTDADGNLVADPDKNRIEGSDLGNPTLVDNGRVFPGQRIAKDPTIKNVGGDDAWVCAKVIIEDGSKDIHKLYGYEGYNEIDIEAILAGGLLDDENEYTGVWNGFEDVKHTDDYAMVQIADRANDKYEFYFFMKNKMSKGDEVTIFEEVFVDPIIDNVGIHELAELKITVQAFAVQRFGFSDCYSAMRTVFEEHFKNCQPAV